MEETKYVTVPIEEYKKAVLAEAMYRGRGRIEETIMSHFITTDTYDLTKRTLKDLKSLGEYGCAFKLKDIMLMRSIGIQDTAMISYIERIALSYRTTEEVAEIKERELEKEGKE